MRVVPTSAVPCVFSAGSLTSADIVSTGTAPAMTVGSTFIVAPKGNGVLNVSANLVQTEDVGTTEGVLPASIAAGGQGVFVLGVTGSGPGPITVTDTVPAGLSIVSAITGSGTCTVSGQSISCTAPSAPATLVIVVSGAAAGTYANAAAATGPVTDPNPANNSASATLSVTPPTIQNPAPMCHTVSLAGVPLKAAKSVVPALGCMVGKLTTKRSKSVPKGNVISTNPSAGKTSCLARRSPSSPPRASPRRRSTNADGRFYAGHVGRLRRCSPSTPTRSIPTTRFAG